MNFRKYAQKFKMAANKTGSCIYLGNGATKINNFLTNVIADVFG
jgi:hypothetical protein